MHKGLLFLSVLLLAACGFQPMYGNMGNNNGPAVETLLAQIEIDKIQDREGVYLRNALIDRFYKGGYPKNPVYRLKTSPVRERLIDLDITKSSDATRGQLRLSTEINLIRTQDNQNVLRRALNVTTSYNILSSEFATRVTEENARQNALDDLARQIELQVGLYLRR